MSTAGMDAEADHLPCNRTAIPAQSGQSCLNEDVSSTVNNECMVCSDKATGLHYSVTTCEGCKGFFKRTVQKQLKYACRGVGQLGGCTITKESRNNCQHCRYKKCLSVGMNVAAVREDRAPGGRPHAKKLRSDQQQLDQDPQTHGQPTERDPSEELFDAPATSSGTDQDIGQDDSFTEEKAGDMIQLLEELKASRPDIIPVKGNEVNHDKPINTMMQCGYQELQLIIRWAKKVPGFTNLCIGDQMCLLKSSFLELNILRLAYRSMATYADKILHFAEGVVLTEEETVKLGWDSELVQSTCTFAKRLSEIKLDYSDFCLLNALILSFPDAAGLTDKESVTRLQARFMDCFYFYCQTKHPQDTKHYGKMLLRLQALRALSAKAASCFFDLIDSGSLAKDDLAQEMFEDGFTSL
ncbi:steroid hormone receptor ERR2-like [Acanthaster planci]|uniref:Steroid hormone receptor ERR2-like n=1 Tax=Acanthaster planci TaxID=133434 RepID=A0A8B7YRH4_ACAPL|nr:steroid hormone receptor ERR2-like [Acanthaster planci]XP_022095883.1 steroid hormone receptor ERR2-like [Acanthaster planci]XP_022095884.1 steroid hormone receptor ERR2-like [Acanthaster planci]